MLSSSLGPLHSTSPPLTVVHPITLRNMFRSSKHAKCLAPLPPTFAPLGTMRVPDRGHPVLPPTRVNGPRTGVCSECSFRLPAASCTPSLFQDKPRIQLGGGGGPLIPACQARSQLEPVARSGSFVVIHEDDVESELSARLQSEYRQRQPQRVAGSPGSVQTRDGVAGKLGQGVARALRLVERASCWLP